MKMVAALSWRNIWRNPLRSLILIASVALGLWAGLFMVGFYQGMNEERLRSGIEEVSHLQMHAPGFKEDYRAALDIPAGDSLARALGARPGLAVAARSLAQGMLSTARVTAGVEIHGVDSAEEAGTSRLPEKVVAGAMFGNHYLRPALIGERLAHKRGLKLGSKIVLTFQDSAADLASGAFRVAGIYKTQDTRFDEGTVFVPRGQLNRLLGLNPAAAHEIAVTLRHPETLDSAAAGLGREFPALKVETWKQISPDLELMEASLSQTLLIFMGIILLGLAFGIVNTMLMAVLDRTRELGMLMALGMRRRRVFLMILSETVMLVLVGTPAGLALAWVSVAVLGRTGIDLGRWGEGLGAYGLAAMVYPTLPAGYYLKVVAMVSVTAMLSSIYPARKALRLKPAEAIRAV